MDDLVTGQSPSAHLFLGGVRCRWNLLPGRGPGFGLAASWQQPGLCEVAWAAAAGYWPTDGEKGVGCWGGQLGGERYG